MSCSSHSVSSSDSGWRIRMFRGLLRNDSPTTLRYPIWLFMGSVLIWHMYHPLSDSLISLIRSCQMRCSVWVTEIRSLLVMTSVSIVSIVWVSTRSHATCNEQQQQDVSPRVKWPSIDAQECTHITVNYSSALWRWRIGRLLSTTTSRHSDEPYNCAKITLYLCKSCTVHVITPSRPTGTVMLEIGALNLGSTGMRVGKRRRTE